MKKNRYIEEYCTGCGLCHSAIGAKLENTNKGFPNVKLSIGDNLDFYEQICPVFHYKGECKNGIWGKVDSALIAYSSNSDLRYKASSGGALSEICIYLLEQGIVDGVIHTTLNPEDSTKTISCVSSTEEEIISRCGSRYSISVPLKNIIQLIDKDKKYAFVGKPCDVMALRKYISMNEELTNIFTYLLSFFCAGEPSVDAQKSLLDRMDCTIDQCENITYRGNGWPGYTTVTKKDGSVSKIEYKIAWGNYLGRDLRNICRFCMDGTGEDADIVCADFWYLDENKRPEFTEHDGRNIIISRSNKGTTLVNDIISAGRLTMEKNFTQSMDELRNYQTHQYRRKGAMKSMIFVMRLFRRPTSNYSRTYLNNYSKHMSVNKKIRFVLGTIKRVLKGTL